METYSHKGHKVEIVISRQEAASQGLVTYFTGQPCKNGHIARRYVTNTACLDCMGRWRRMGAKHPFSHDKIPMESITLWRSRRLDQHQLADLNKYIQMCIDKFCEHVLPPLCKTCDGLKKVPNGDGTNRWKTCPACSPDEKVIE